MAEYDDTSRSRSLLTGFGALVGVAVLVGGVISLVVLGVVNITGLGDTSAVPQAKQSLYIPPERPHPNDPTDPNLTLADLNGGRTPSPSDSASPRAQTSPSPTKKPQPRPKPQPPAISLSASPVTVAPMGQIYLSGTYPGGEGATLQVQRLESGSWNNFPSSTTVSGGTFSTYVMSGTPGPNKFRVVDDGNGRKSNDVTVTVR